MIIKTERLILKPLDISNLETTHEYASDVDNTKYMIHLPNKIIDETEQFLIHVTNEWKKEKPSFYEFAIYENNIHIGAVSAYIDVCGEEAELGWIINKNFQGKGYATEAAKAIMNFATNNLKVKKVVAHCDYRNEASCKVMKKIGMILERDDKTRQYKDSVSMVQELMFSIIL